MSENSEHTPDDTETETKAMEDLPNDSSTSETKLKMMNHTDATLLEDEEMPTYISVSSTSKRDDSDVVNAKQQDSEIQEEDRSPSPYPSDDQAPSSVYVLSSEEETDQPPYNDEDDEDEYVDSEEMDNLELDNEFVRERLEVARQMNPLLDEEDDDEDDEDEEEDEEGFRQMHNDEDDDVDSNCERAWYDRRSDDFVLTKRLKSHDKEKSLSLQDLNTYKNNTYAGYSKRRQLHGLRPNYLNIPQNAVMYSMVSRKQPIPAKYQHIPSKVKHYIKDIKEQNRRSMERNMKQHQEDTIHNKNNTDCENNDTEKPTITNKIKDYAERTIKELEIAEVYDKNKVAYNASSVMVNGQDNRNGLESIHEESNQNEVQLNVPAQSETDPSNTDDNKQKQNGTVEVKQLKFNFSERGTAHFGDAMQPSLVQNGHQEVPTILYDLRPISYEEYMRANSSQKTDLNKNAHVIEQQHIQHETYNNAEPMDVDDDTTCTLKIENIKSIRTMADEAKNNSQVTFDKINEGFNNKPTSDTLEIVTLKDQLHQKTVQYNDLHDAYQKQFEENLKMKQELDELRKSLARYKEESKPVEQRAASIQTDIITDSISTKYFNAEPTHTKQSNNNKISGSSVASTLSSIDQWSDSLSLSMKPPEVTKALQSDDSAVLTDGTPRKKARSLSRAFITSSRILQTLSSITQGKTKSESPLVQNSKKRVNENAAMELQNDGSFQNRSLNFKKRKIADMPGPSNQQSFKASESTAESNLKLNDTPNVESQFKYSCDSANERVQSQEGTSNISTNQLGTATSTAENKTTNADDPEDNVKCFVYHENENSKDRSFLILAESVEEDKTVNEKGRIRECGPFLLGNVEVRMSEINGTINIWGKEVSQETTAETENEAETSAKMKDDNKYHCWQKTSHARFNGSNLVCSTSKKAKVPSKFELSPAAFNLSCAHSSSLNMAKPSCSMDKTHADNLYSPSACTSSYEDCDSSKNRKEWLRFKRSHLQEKLHSCCIHNVDMSEQKCNCSLHKERQKFEDNFHCSKEKLSTKEHRQSFSKNLEPNKHLHENVANCTMEDSESTCRYHMACHRSSHDHGENCQESHKCCNVLRETCTCKPSTSTDRECSESCIHSSNAHEEEPLIEVKQCSETPETRRRKLIGKRVRGVLMDLLRGCGDCYNSNTSTNNKSYIHKKESHLLSCSPQIKITPCASPEPSCSNPEQPAGRCCHAYAKRIESQLEEFRVEMERVRTRSDAILNMLNMLQSVDTN